MGSAELQTRGSVEDNSKIFLSFLNQKNVDMLYQRDGCNDGSQNMF